MKIKYQIKRWLGLFTREGRDNLPVGALEDCENLVFNTKSFKPSLRTGYSAGLSGSLADLSGDTTITSYRYPRGVHPATETPSAQNVVVLCGTDGSANKHYFQRPFWKHNDATADSTNWLKWKESKTTTISAIVNPTVIEITAGSATADYYNGWLIHNTTRNEYEYITDYGAMGARTVTLYENTPSDWIAGDTVILYRHFHDNPTFSPSWTDPIVLKQGNDILASGGQGSTVGYKGIWSGYINKTWFAGASLNPSYNQTYVTEAEIKSTAGITSDSNVAGVATVAVDESVAKRAFAYMVFETHDGQRSNPVTIGYDDLTAGSAPSGMATAALVTRIRVAFSRMNKRIGKIHYFCGTADVSSGRTSLEWDEIFYITTSDLITDGADWTVNAPGAAPGDFSKFFTLDGNAWNSRGEDLATFLGHTEPNRSTVSFSHGIIVGGRLFVSKYYDYNAAASYNDQVNFSPFASNGVSQWNKLLDIDDQVQTSIEAGDPSTIKGLAHLDGKLFIAKDRGIYFIDITYDPSQWILNTVTREIGCDAPDSVVTTPEGIIWAKSGDGVYLWRGGDPIEISRNWRDTFRALTTTYASQWWGWYDPYYRSYRIMYTANGSTLTTVYEAFLDVTDPAIGNLPIWTKHIMAHNVGQVTVRSDGAVFFSTGAAATYQFSSSATDDAGTGIKPYFKLGTRVIDEHKIFVFQAFNLTVSQSGGTSGQLDISNYVDGNVVGTFTNLTKTASRFSSELPDIDSDGHTRHGYNFDFAFNSNGTRAVLGTSYTIFDLTIDGYLMERGGDVRQSL